MQIPTRKNYQEVIENSLSVRQVEILQTLYYSPNSSATAKELADELGYAGHQGASMQIGVIGKVISDYTGIIPPFYIRKGKEQPAYYLLIGKYYADVGWAMRGELKRALVQSGYVSEAKDESTVVKRLPTETSAYDEQRLFEEGKVVKVFVNRYERSQKARRECIKHYGYQCYACGFDFGKVYGVVAEGFIQVHHKTPLSEVNESYKVDPIKDLVPLCANCHSVVHLVRPAMSIEELKGLLGKSAKHS